MPVESKDGAHWLAPTITAHAWNPDRTQLALCPNTGEVWIYTGCDRADASTWERSHVLKEHDMAVGDIDWCAATNKIVTCSEDRNAFVWSFDEAAEGGKGAWKPCMAVLRIERAAIKCVWAPNGLKFAVASGSKCVPVCHFEEEHDWWVSDPIKKHKSTVLSVAWHPNSILLATACSDFKCRIFNAFKDGVDAAPDSGPFAVESDTFADLFMELDMSKGWVEDVSWSPAGDKLVFVGHDSSVTFVHLAADPSASVSQTVHFTGLPFTQVEFATDSAVVAAGHDFNPALFVVDGSGYWTFVDNLDKKKAGGAVKSSSSFGAARAMFAAKTTTGTAGATDNKVWTKHQAAITGLCVHSPPGEPASRFSTGGLDGRIVVWDLRACGVALAGTGL